MSSKKEVWKPLEGYENRYQISSHGNVRSIKTNTRWGGMAVLDVPYMRNIKGRQALVIKDKKPKAINIGREVAKAFIPNPQNKRFILHIDGDISNNNISNLKWITGKELRALQIEKSHGNGYKSLKTLNKEAREAFNNMYGCDRSTCKPVAVYDEYKTLIKIYPSVHQCAEELSLSRFSIINYLKAGFERKFHKMNKYRYYFVYVDKSESQKYRYERKKNNRQ